MKYTITFLGKSYMKVIFVSCTSGSKYSIELLGNSNESRPSAQLFQSQCANVSTG